MIKGLRRDPLSRVAKRRRVTFGDGSPGAAVGCLAKLYLMLVESFFKSFCSTDRRLKKLNFVFLSWEKVTAKLQNTGPLIYISLNHKSAYCVILRSSKDFGPGCILQLKVAISALKQHYDDECLGKKVTDCNKVIKSFCNQNGWS